MVTLTVHVQPNASRNEVVGMYGDSLRLKITSPPLEGKANKSCCEFLATILELKKSQVEIRTGHKSKKKVLAIKGITHKEMTEKLQKIAEKR
ncbi:MAG: DUF167 domain-containing protein [Thermodesulfobacteriota bacterium]|nr:DUF167 domain-containing protein [Thermodesulfobacteriota bacterium]